MNLTSIVDTESWGHRFPAPRSSGGRFWGALGVALIGTGSLLWLLAGRGQAQQSGSAPSRAASKVSRVELEHRDIPGDPAKELRLYLITYPPGAVIPVHHHPTVGVGYILEGCMESAFGNDQPKRYHAGQSFADDAVTPHMARNCDAHRPLKFLIAYALKKGEPTLITP